MKILLYNVNSVLAFELRRLGDFDFYTHGSSKWNYNLRPRPSNIQPVSEIDESEYKCVVSEDFSNFEFQNIRRVQALDIPFLSAEHYSYVKKSSTEFAASGSFQNENEIKTFVKLVAGQKVAFLGPPTGVCKNIEIPLVQNENESIKRFYNYINVLGNHIGYVNVSKKLTNYNVYEAMLLGLPVVSVKTDPEFKHGVCGLFSDDPFELRSYLAHLIKNPDLALKMGAGAKKYIEKRFAQSTFYKEWKETLQ